MPSLTGNRLDQLQLTGAIAGVLGRLHYYRGRQSTYASVKPEVLEELRQTTIIQGTKSSNEVEGIRVEDDRYHELVIDNRPANTRTEHLLLSYRDALAHLHTHHHAIDLSPETILDIHRRIYARVPEAAGSYRQKPAHIERKEPGKDPIVVYEASPPNLIERQLITLCQDYRRLKETPVDPFILLAGVILDFLCIHPFEDGNGRVSRLLTTLVGYHLGFEIVRYIPIERIIAESKLIYYWQLTDSSREWHRSNHRWHGWLEYLAGAFVTAYEELEGKLQQPVARGQKSEMVREAIRNANSRFTIRDLINACPTVTRPTIAKVLLEEQTAGLIVSDGKGPRAGYRKVSIIDQPTRR